MKRKISLCEECGRVFEPKRGEIICPRCARTAEREVYKAVSAIRGERKGANDEYNEI